MLFMEVELVKIGSEIVGQRLRLIHFSFVSPFFVSNFLQISFFSCIPLTT